MALLQAVYALPRCAAQNLLHSLMHLLRLHVPVPHSSTVSRRRCTLSATVPHQCQHERVHLVVDATGLDVYGEGEWYVRQHGWT